MRQRISSIGYGFLIWVIPFIISLSFYPVRLSNHPFFQSLMSVVLVASVILASILYFREFTYVSLAKGFMTGIFWLLISFFLDIGVFIFGPIHMILTEYLSEIFTAYLLIPLITTGFTYIKIDRERRRV